MQDRPSLDEMLAGVERFLKKQVAPRMEDPLRFHSLVAANLLAIARRELAGEGEALERELAGLKDLLPPAASRREASLPQQVRALNGELCCLIQEGGADQNPGRQELLAHLARVLDDKLATCNPANREIFGKLF